MGLRRPHLDAKPADVDAEAHLRRIVAASGDAVIGVAADGTIVSWNGAAERILGHHAADVRGRPIALLVPADLTTDEPASALAERSQETVRLHRDGKRVPVLLTVIPVQDRTGAIVGATHAMRDLSEQKQTLAVLAQLRVAIDAAPNGIVMINERGVIVMVNTQMERLFGYERAEMIGQTIELLIPQRYRDTHPAQRSDYLTKPEVRAMGHGRELFARRKDGTEFPVEVGLNPAHTPQGTFVLGAVIDISARKQMEAERAHLHTDLQEHAHELEATVAERTAHLQQTIAELESVSYSLSHDLRGPLRTIQGFVQLVLEDADSRLNAEEKELLAKAVRASHRLDRLIQDVLTYTRVSRQSITLDSVDVERLLRQIIDERPELQRPRAEIELVGPLHPVRGHEASLTQIFTNLLDNAVKFVAPGQQPRVRVQSRLLGDRVELTVADNGIGIPREAQARLFSIFQRVHDDKKYAGTGIGLAIVRKAVERMGGSVSLESEDGKGTRFLIQLPKGTP